MLTEETVKRAARYSLVAKSAQVPNEEDDANPDQMDQFKKFDTLRQMALASSSEKATEVAQETLPQFVEALETANKAFTDKLGEAECPVIDQRKFSEALPILLRKPRGLSKIRESLETRLKEGLAPDAVDATVHAGKKRNRQLEILRFLFWIEESLAGSKKAKQTFEEKMPEAMKALWKNWLHAQLQAEIPANAAESQSTARVSAGTAGALMNHIEKQAKPFAERGEKVASAVVAVKLSASEARIRIGDAETFAAVASDAKAYADEEKGLATGKYAEGLKLLRESNGEAEAERLLLKVSQDEVVKAGETALQMEAGSMGEKRSTEESELTADEKIRGLTILGNLRKDETTRRAWDALRQKKYMVFAFSLRILVRLQRKMEDYKPKMDPSPTSTASKYTALVDFESSPNIFRVVLNFNFILNFHVSLLLTQYTKYPP